LFYTGRSTGGGTAGNNEQGTEEYNTTKGMLASTSGNIFGIYDMSGGAFEYIAAWDTKGKNENAYINYGNSFAKSGGKSTKYATAYSNGMTNSEMGYNYPTTEKCILGDATYEVNTNLENDTYAWFNDYVDAMNSTQPFLIRGGFNANTVISGVFYAYGNGGSNHDSRSFRIVLPGI